MRRYLLLFCSSSLCYSVFFFFFFSQSLFFFFFARRLRSRKVLSQEQRRAPSERVCVCFFTHILLLILFSFPFTFYFIIFVCLRFASISIVAITQRVRDAIFLRVSPYLGSMLATIIEITKVTNDRGDIYIYIYIYRESFGFDIYSLSELYVQVEGKLRPIKGR